MWLDRVGRVGSESRRQLLAVFAQIQPSEIQALAIGLALMQQAYPDLVDAYVNYHNGHDAKNLQAAYYDARERLPALR